MRRGSLVALAILVGACSSSSGDAPNGVDAGAGAVFTVEGLVAGLEGHGLVMRNNARDDVTVVSNGRFTFGTRLADGAPFEVTVGQQPAAPAQECDVTGGAGTVHGANVLVAVSCKDIGQLVGGTVAGLVGQGLVLHNGTEDLSIGASGPFAFSQRSLKGTQYSVTVKTQPSSPTQTCTLAGATGTIANDDVSSVVVNCSKDAFTVGGTVSGLSGSVTLQVNGGNPQTVTANGTYAFSQPLASGSPYAVTVSAQPGYPPTSQTCTVSRATGTITSSNVTNVDISCVTDAFTVGGSVSGLVGTGLVLANGTDTVSVSADGPFAFPTLVPSGNTYGVSISAQPAGQTCTLTSRNGTVGGSNVTSVAVTCSDAVYTIGGSISGLSGSITLQNNGAGTITASANGTYAFPGLTSGSPYDVTVFALPTYPPRSQTCVVSNPSGTVAAANVTNVDVTCTTDAFLVGGTVTGLTGTGLVLASGTETLPVGGAGPFAFATAVPSGNNYRVTVSAQPSGQVCTLANASGVVGGGDVTNVSVTCLYPVFTEDFDTVTSPGLPAGWSSTAASGTTAFTTVTNYANTAPNSVFVTDPSSVSDVRLESPSIAIGTSSAQLSFSHRYSTEGGCDGAVLEISIAGGAFQDILAAGGSFLDGAYPTSKLGCSSAALYGRGAWTGSTSGAWVPVSVALPAAAVGQSVVLRWRLASDGSVGASGWWIDSVFVLE